MDDPKRGVTRRQLAAGVAGAVPLLAQTPANPPNELVAAREQTIRNGKALRNFKLGALVEPSFAFKP